MSIILYPNDVQLRLAEQELFIKEWNEVTTETKRITKMHNVDLSKIRIVPPYGARNVYTGV